MPRNLYKIISFPSSDTNNGTLFMYQEAVEAVPFPVKRILVMKGMQGNDRRGGHTHHEGHQVLIAISGGCTVDLDDGNRKEQITLETPQQGLVLYPYVWHTMHTFRPNTILMSIADQTYDEKDYIRDYEEFKRLTKHS